MNNIPFEMIYKESYMDKGKKVLVYDFIHDTIDTFQSCALCWVPSSKAWLTAPVALLTPVIKTKKKKLNEDIINE